MANTRSIRDLWDAGLNGAAASAAFAYLRKHGTDALQSELDILFGTGKAGGWTTRGGSAFILKVRATSIRIPLD
ncbi:hypothetical protein [Vibrio phage 29Fa.3]|nr:hypothetical protein [Vibrio phage 29Fa.3]